MEDLGGGEKTKHGGWTWPFWNEEIGKFKFDELTSSDALLPGRITYQGSAKAWPSMKDKQGFVDRMNRLPKFVVSTTLEKVDWNNSTLIKGPVAEEVLRLKQQPGPDILVAGSAALVQTLAKHDLIDEYRLLVYPVVLGSGKRLFGDGINKTLHLLEAKSFSTGVVLLRYGTEKKGSKAS